MRPSFEKKYGLKDLTGVSGKKDDTLDTGRGMSKVEPKLGNSVPLSKA